MHDFYLPKINLPYNFTAPTLKSQAQYIQKYTLKHILRCNDNNTTGEYDGYTVFKPKKRL